MHKKKICLIVLLLKALLLTACATLYRPESPPAGWPEELPYLNLAKRNEIDQAWAASGRDGRDWFTHEVSAQLLAGHRYLGTYQGYDIIHTPGSIPVLSGIQIGSESFHYFQSFSLLAYKDHEFWELKEVYEMGYISDQEISQIAQVFQAYQDYVQSETSQKDDKE